MGMVLNSIKRAHPLAFKTLIGVLIGISVSISVFLLYLLGFFTTIENKTGDMRFRLFTREETRDPDIVIIAIDEQSFQFYRNSLGMWPWPREVFGSLVRYLTDAGARLIVFDMLFAEPDLLRPDSDDAFTRAIEESGIVILPLVFRPGEEALGEDDYRALIKREYMKEEFALKVENVSDIEFFDYSQVTIPYFDFFLVCSGTGSINFTADSDGPCRSVYPLYSYQGGYFPSMPLTTAMRILGIDSNEEGGIKIRRDRLLSIGDINIPLLEDGRMPINWHGPFGTYKYYRVGDVFESMKAMRNGEGGESSKVSPEEFNDRIVIIGATAVSLFDLRATPFSSVYPGVEINATIIDNMINGDYVKQSSWYHTLAIIIFLSLFVALVSIRVDSASFAITFLLLIWVIFTAGTAYLFQSHRVMVDYVAPSFALFFSFVSSLVFNYVTEGRSKRKFKDAFAKYVSPHVAEEISKNIDDLKVDVGERKEVTILFSDIRNFTSMSEKLPPEEVVRLLNRYFHVMVEVIFRFDGTLDKYIGDAIMAFFGAPKSDPEHAKKACLAAISMQEELIRLNREWEEEGIMPMAVGIGINTGEVVVGNIGSERRIDYTVIGDHVNLASRLEGVNKEFGTSIIISEFTLGGVEGLEVRDLGEVNVKGKEYPVKIFELLGSGEGGAGGGDRD